MVPGCPGNAATDTASVCVALLPQVFPAETATVPPVAPTVAVTVLVAELPAQPAGRDQV